MGMKLNTVNKQASNHAFGFSATSRSIKPVHIAQVVFGHTLGDTRSPDLLFEVLQKPSKKPSSELSREAKEKFEFSYNESEEELDNIRKAMRSVLNNDNALYASQRGSAPTCTSDWLVINPGAGVTMGRFVHRLLRDAEAPVEEKIKSQLRDHHDSLSLLFRPLAKDAPVETTKVETFEDPRLAPAFGDGHIGSDLITGYENMNEFLKSRNGRSINYPRDLRRIVKFGCFALYSYMANRNNEIRETNARDSRLPLLFNYTGARDNPIAKASGSCVDLVQLEIKSACRHGVREELDRLGFKSYDDDRLLKELDEGSLLDLKRKQEEKIKEDIETFYDMFSADPAETTFERLVNTVSDAIHLSRYKTYTPVDTIQTFGWRCGLLKPRGNRANIRRFTPDPDLLEPIILSVLSPDESISLQNLCARLRDQYGIIVGGTSGDRRHLSEWDISIGASSTESDPLANRNYEGFKEVVIDLGFAREYADGVTIVSPST